MQYRFAHFRLRTHIFANLFPTFYPERIISIQIYLVQRREFRFQRSLRNRLDIRRINSGELSRRSVCAY